MANMAEMALTFNGTSFWGDLKINQESRGIRRLPHLSLSQNLERENHILTSCGVYVCV